MKKNKILILILVILFCFSVNSNVKADMNTDNYYNVFSNNLSENNENIDNIDETETFKSKSAGDKINFSIETYGLNSDIISIKITSKDENKITAKVFNISEQKRLKLSDIFMENADYIGFIKKYIVNHNILGKKYEENYLNNIDTNINEALFENFMLTENGIIIYYNKAICNSDEMMIKTVNISYKDVKTMLSDEIFKAVFEKGKTKKVITGPAVAITFDDGPSTKTTGILLDGLKKYNASATFYVVGNRLNSKTAPLITRMINEGHQVGSHGYSHKQLTKLNLNGIKSEISTADNNILSIYGRLPSTVRPPYGSYNKNVADYINRPIVLWSLDTLDWKYRNTETIVNKVLNTVKDGDIILFHDVYDTSVESALIIVEKLSQAGYSFVTVEELYEYHGIKMEPNKVYFSAKSVRTIK